MSTQNICKFITAALPHTLSVSCFVLEADPTVMEQPSALREHRAMLVIEGEGRFHLDRDIIPFRPGSLVFGFRGERFSVEFQEPVTLIYVGFDGARADELFRRFDIRQSNRSFDGFDGLIPFWRESLSRASEQTIDLASESVLLYTFSRLNGAGGERNDLVQRMIALSEEQFTDPELSISVIAEALSYNPKYLSHLFKERMGTTYSEYLRTLRIKYAVSLFDHGIDSVKNVALLSGFSDPLYFSTVFKSSVGLSPSEYKKRAASKK